MNLSDVNLVLDLIKEGERIDGRKFDEYRKLEFQKGVSKYAEGSYMVKLGNTIVIAGVKLEIGQPFPDTPDEGYFVVNFEEMPFSSEDVEPGPPGEDELEIARVVDRVIRESEAIDLKKLCIKEGEKVWGIIIDIYSINNDGNLIDASTMAAVLALSSAVFPKYEDEKVNYLEKTDVPVPLRKIPLNISIAKVGGKFIVDPTKLEEEAAEYVLTVGISNGKINSLQKRGSGGIPPKDLKEIIPLALKKYEELKKVIESEVSKGK